MTKAELIDEVHKNVDGNLTKKETSQAVQAVFDTLAEAIRKDERFSFPGFGTFKLKERAPRKGRNPQTGQSITIPASKTVSFKPAPGLKDEL